jgi:hypothetical protein
MRGIWHEVKRDLGSWPVVVSGSPPPIWFCLAGDPFPVIATSGGPQCTDAHRHATWSAHHTALTLRSLVALGMFNVADFLREWLPASSAEKYLNHLYGWSILRTSSREDLEEAVLALAQARSLSENPARVMEFRSLGEIAKTLDSTELLSTCHFFLEDAMVHAVPSATGGAAALRREGRHVWALAVRGYIEIFGRAAECSCHALGRAYERDMPGPPTDRQTLNKGGDRSRPGALPPSTMSEGERLALLLMVAQLGEELRVAQL